MPLGAFNRVLMVPSFDALVEPHSLPLAAVRDSLLWMQPRPRGGRDRCYFVLVGRQDERNIRILIVLLKMQPVLEEPKSKSGFLFHNTSG